MDRYVIAAARSAPGVYAKLFDMIPSSRWDERLDPARFSPREVMCHMAEWDPIFCERISAALNEDMALVQDYDEGQIAIDHDYAHQDIAHQLQLFAERRERMVRMFEGLSEEELLRRFNQPPFGVMVLRDYLPKIIGHDTYHVEQLLGYVGEKVAAVW